MVKDKQEKYKPQRAQSSQRKTGINLLIVKKALTSLSVFSVVKSGFYPVLCLLSSVFVFASIGYGAEEHAAHHAAEFKPLTEAFRIINFLVVFVTLYYLLSKHIKNFFAGRREDIVKSLNDAEQLKSSAQKRLSELESKIKEMKNTVLQMIEDARREGKHTKDNIIGSANESSKKIMEKAKKEIEYETKIVMERLRAEALELTIRMAENILKKSVTKNDHVSMVNEYIKGIGTGEAGLG
ncbi:MAG: F0F1 ATP synthase subunit B [Nitrospinae bacterium]|nr:F0F1 ATP synthase subunit B [Nitrospinota bacterium]